MTTELFDHVGCFPDFEEDGTVETSAYVRINVKRPGDSWLRTLTDQFRDLEGTNEEILNEVATTFWIVFIFYVLASVSWIAYCIISYIRDVEKLRLTAEKNSIARYLELRRLLKAYDRVDIENLRSECEVDDEVIE